MRRWMQSFVAMAILGWALACGGSSTPGTDLTGTDPGTTDLPDVPEPGDVPEDSPRDVTPGDPGTDPAGDPGGTDTAPDSQPADPGGDGTPPADPGHDPGGTCIAGDPCDDGNPCTYGEKCSAAGVCEGGTAYACDDGRPCTEDQCDGKGNCRFTVKKDACLIHGICRQKDEANPDVPCQVCDPAKPGEWSAAGTGTECDPSGALAACELAAVGACQDGACIPQNVVPNDCDDLNPCTTDRCSEPAGCSHEAVTGPACVLDDPCKVGTCRQGRCVILPSASCDDGNPCTLDECRPELGGCVHTPLSDTPCDDLDACTLEDYCLNGACVGLPDTCDDGNICTVDGCNAITGCWHDLATNSCCEGGVSRCDDGNACTNDLCTEDGLGCLNEPNTARCDDGNSCTVNDTCSDGFCAGVSKNCSDGNPCTRDWCDKGKCFHEAQNGIPCDDGLECSVNDHCEAGVCVADTSPCVCQPTFSPVVNKFVSMSIADNGQAGNGLNLDDNAATCAPSSNCCCGVDNSLGPVAGLPVANDGIKKAMDEGQIVLLFEHRNFRTDGGAYTLAFYAGKLDPTNPTCDFKTQSCKYIVDHNIFDQDCNPLVTLDNAKVVGNKLTAGGRQYRFPFDLPLVAGINLHVDLYATKVEATVTLSGGKIAAMAGILGGAVPKQQIIDAITAIPDDQWPPDIPVDKGTILSLIEILVEPDIDGDGDGQPESASIGIKFNAIGGTITGVY